MKTITIAICIFLLFFSCSAPEKQPGRIKRSQAEGFGFQLYHCFVTPLPKPVFGYRFVVTGDFDGDGKREKLTEHFYSLRDRKEAAKFYENLDDYGDFVTATCAKRPYTFMLSDQPSMDTLRITDMEQQCGLSFVRNEGDLNGDGTDELSYVINKADWSSCNKWYIVTYRHKRWETLYSFEMRDWMLPEVPQTANSYSLFGVMDKAVSTTEDSIIQQQIKALDDFEGLVKKLKGSRIRVIYFTTDAEVDTMTVNLRGTVVPI